MKHLAGATVLALMLSACGANHGAQNVLPMQGTATVDVTTVSGTIQ